MARVSNKLMQTNPDQLSYKPSIVGLIMAVFGIVSLSDTAMYQRSLGINVNLWWGLAMTVFGLAMLALSWRASRKAKTP